MDIKKCYKILKLKNNASIEEIKLAYREQVKKHHPDHIVNNTTKKLKSEEKLKEINQAFAILKANTVSKENKIQSQKPSKHKSTTSPGSDEMFIFFEDWVKFWITAWHDIWREMGVTFEKMFAAAEQNNAATTQKEKKTPRKTLSGEGKKTYETKLQFEDVLESIGSSNTYTSQKKISKSRDANSKYRPPI